MKNTLAILLVVGVLSSLCGASGNPNNVVFQSGDEQTSLLEIFSSEGCSSCPPAEEWLTNLKGSPDLWTKFIPVSFHVDYWDNLGWKDIFSSPRYTQRQQAYAHWLNLDSVYTPGFILNGQEWKGWFDGQRAVPSLTVKGGSLRVELSKPLMLIVNYQPIEKDTGPWQASAVVLGMNIESRVTAGENKGRTLHHDFVVLSDAIETLDFVGHKLSANVSLKSPTIEAKEYAIAVWVTKTGQSKPWQAVGGVVPVKFVR